MEKLKMHTEDCAELNIQKIGQLFPNCLTERLDENGKPEIAIDFDKLKQELSKDIIEGNQERYQFTWPGKREAMRLANTPSNMTLRPDRESSVDFDTTENLYIEGDNLEVLKLLRENYLGKVKMIYIDPPYNTGNDFVYEDDFSETVGKFRDKSGMFDENGNMVLDSYSVNTESNGRFHTDWLNMMFPRLRIAKDLLTQNGVIFISIDDNEVDNLRKLCDEVFGNANFVAEMIWQQGKKSSGNLIGVNHEYILVYAKNKSLIDCPEYAWRQKKEGLEKIYSKYNQLKELYKKDTLKIQNGIREFYNSLPENDPAYQSKHYNYVDEKGLFFADNSCAPDRPETRSHRPLIHPITGKPTAVPSLGWRWKDETLDKMVAEGRFYYGEDETTVPKVKKYLTEMEYEIPSTVLYKDGRGASKRLENLLGGKYFDFPKDENVIKNLINMVSQDCNSSDIILDFFSGSATTAHSVMALNSEDGGNRRYILVQIPEETGMNSTAYKAGLDNICKIGEERIRRAGKLFNNTSIGNDLFSSDIDKKIPDTGFRVLKLDTSNMQDVYYKPEDSSDATLFEDNVKPDRTAEDLLFQVMLECNLPLSAKIEKKTISGKEVFNVNDGYLLACLDEDVNETVITEVAKQKPYYFIMRDKSLSSDNVADNFEQIFNAYSKDTIRKIL